MNVHDPGFINKILLGLGGGVFLSLSVLLIVLGFTSTGGIQSTIVYVVLFFVVGSGFFIALDNYAASLRPRWNPLYSTDPESDDIDSAEPLHEDLTANSAIDPTSGPNPVASSGGGGASERMNHLEKADFLFTKFKDLNSPEESTALIGQTIEELKNKGYSEKGIGEFANHLTKKLLSLTEESLKKQNLDDKKIKNIFQNRQAVLEILNKHR